MFANLKLLLRIWGDLRESQFRPKFATVSFLELVAVVEETLLMGVPIAIDLVVVDTLGTASP
jgi:hypothetical protein